MAWYGPINEETGKNKIVIGKAFDGKDPYAYEYLKRENMFLIPCGKCIGCKLDYARHWADRMMLEYESCHKAVFVTLTYEDKWLPNVNPETGELFSPSDLNEDEARIAPLIKSDLSEFMKSLRSKFSDNNHDVRIRFFGCGEYGEKKHRPHFHVILFGIDLQDLQITFSGDIRGTLEPWVKNELGQVSFRSNLLEDVWKERGIVTVSETSYETFGYVGRYSLKKARGNKYPEKYNLPKEFTNMSRNPGIGIPFLKEHQEAVEEVNQWYVNGKDIYWPKILIQKYCDIDELGNIGYYDRDDEDPILIEKREQRKMAALNSFLNTYENSDVPYYEKSDFLEKQVTKRVNLLKRGDVTLN